MDRNLKIEFYRKIFSNTLKRWRKEHRVSQVDLALDIGVHPKTISSWENRKSWPEFDQLILLCEAMNILPGEIFELYNPDLHKEYEEFRFESEENPTVSGNIKTFETVYYHSARVIYTNDPNAKRFTGKDGLFELMFGTNIDDERIIRFTVFGQRYTSFLSEKLNPENEVVNTTENQYSIKTKSFQYIFEVNNSINGNDIDLFFYRTHFPRQIRWGSLILENEI